MLPAEIAPEPVPEALPVATIDVAGFGTIEVALYEHKAPKTVANFIRLAEQGFYEGTTFHRVIPEFMIQGGDPLSKNRDPRDDGLGGPDEKLPDEFNDLAHIRGTISMANSGTPNSAGSQFFITVADQPKLDGGYAAFGRVNRGMEVADSIAAVETDLYGRHGPTNRPLENVVIEKITIVQP